MRARLCEEHTLGAECVWLHGMLQAVGARMQVAERLAYEAESLRDSGCLRPRLVSEEPFRRAAVKASGNVLRQLLAVPQQLLAHHSQRVSELRHFHRSGVIHTRQSARDPERTISCSAANRLAVKQDLDPCVLGVAQLVDPRRIRARVCADDMPALVQFADLISRQKSRLTESTSHACLCDPQ